VIERHQMVVVFVEQMQMEEAIGFGLVVVAAATRSGQSCGSVNSGDEHGFERVLKCIDNQVVLTAIPMQPTRVTGYSTATSGSNESHL
jgi:hypothetical protein